MMVIVIIFMSQYSIAGMSLASSQHCEAPPQITGLGMSVGQNWSQIYGQQVAHGKFQSMGIYTSHGGRCWKSMMDLVNGLIPPFGGMELIMNPVKPNVRHQHANWQLD